METILQQVAKIPGSMSFILQSVIIVLMSFVVRWIWRNVFIRIAKKTSTMLDRRIFEATTGAAQIAFIAAGFSFTWNLFGKGIVGNLGVISWINSDFVLSLANHLFFMFSTFSIMYLIWKALFAVVNWYEQDIAPKTTTTLDEKIIFSLKKVLKAMFFIFSAMIISDHFQLQISKLWAAAGIGSLAVALAAKDTFANMISGVIILFDRPFLVGDRIELADGSFGDVVDIGLRSTKILSFDNTIFIIPNADLSAQRITNHTYPDNKLKVALNVDVAYGSDLKQVKEIIGEILTNHPKVLNVPAWRIWFTEFGESSLKLFARYWINEYRDKFDTKDEINTEIYTRFGEENIVIPFPQREVLIRYESLGKAPGTGQNPDTV